MNKYANDEKLLTDFSNAEAFERVYQQFHKPLYYLARRYVVTREDAEDITADAFTKFWRKKEGFNDLASIEAFLRITTRNACLNFFRDTASQSRKRKELMTELSDDDTDIFREEEFEAELYRQLYREIEKLPPKSRKVFKLAYVEGLKNEEIAQLLNISYQTVKNQKAHSLKLLRLALLQKSILLPYCLLQLLACWKS